MPLLSQLKAEALQIIFSVNIIFIQGGDRDDQIY